MKATKYQLRMIIRNSLYEEHKKKPDGMRSVRKGADKNPKVTKMDFLPDDVLDDIASEKDVDEALSTVTKEEARALEEVRRIIKEAIEVHQVPVDLDTVDSEEAYGIGYIKGAEQDTNTDEDGCGGTVALADDIDDAVPSTSQMPASWRQILGNTNGFRK
jgi:hypothetical protein